MKIHKGGVGSVVTPPPGTGFLRESKHVDKSKRCSVCGGTGGTYRSTRLQRYPRHERCTGIRTTITREKKPCECPCRLDLLDPDL